MNAVNSLVYTAIYGEATIKYGLLSALPLAKFPCLLTSAVCEQKPKIDSEANTRL